MGIGSQRFSNYSATTAFCDPYQRKVTLDIIGAQRSRQSVLLRNKICVVSGTASGGAALTPFHHLSFAGAHSINKILLQLIGL